MVLVDNVNLLQYICREVFSSKCCGAKKSSPLYPVYTIKLARQAGYMLAGRASSMFAWRLLDVCSMSARCLLDVCSIV